MTLKRPWLSSHEPDSYGANKRRPLEPSVPECLSSMPVEQHYNQGRPSAELFPTYEYASVVELDGNGDIGMGNVEDIVAEPPSSSDYTSPPPDSPALIPEFAGYTSDHKQDICFGMICYVEVQLLDNPHIFNDTHLFGGERNSQYPYQLRIIPQNKSFVLQSISETNIGVFNTTISKCLQDLSGTASIRYESFVDPNIWRETIQTWKKSGKRGNLFVNVQVYGPRDVIKRVGEVFSKARLYFQHPDHCDGSIKYENPHFLSFSSIGVYNSAIPKSQSTSLYQSQSFSKRNISEVLENLDQQDYIREADIDTRVRTPLLSHQKAGADFIMQREAGRVPSALLLWKPKQQDSTRSFYEHLITGSRRQVIPDSVLGGIISDEMGMGKSLTMLSAIVGSLAASELFAQSGDRDSASHGILKPASKATLILVPSALVLEGWMEEIETHILPSTLNVHRYHGSKRESNPLRLLDFDVIITTYATVAAEFRRCSNVLYCINWFRVVLDEAHSIRHQSTVQFRAISTMTSKFRWCLTGTPIQNSLTDLGALVRFLRLPQLETTSAFRTHIMSPIESGSSKGFLNLRLLLKSLCLRRTNELLQLSKPITHIYRLDLTKSEDAAYGDVGETYRQEIDKAVSGGKTEETHGGILRAILRLRMFCNHGTYGSCSGELGDTLSSDLEGTLTLLDDATCAYCSCDVAMIGKSNEPQLAKFTVCSHLLCSECLPQYAADLEEARVGKKAQCPLCANVIVGSFLGAVEKKGCKKAVGSSVSPAPLGSFETNGGYSTKLSALLQDVEMQKVSDKSIVFSVWKKSLDLVACLFSARNIPFATIDGSLSLLERSKELSNFKSKPDIKVLLMTFGTGAVGLNLTVASRIHILEPQWNPSVEKQAIGRILRLGQDKQVTIIRYIMNGTVEEYIESRQVRKLQLATVGWEQQGDNDENQKLKELLELRSLLLRD